MLVVSVPHQCSHTVFLNAVEVDLARLLGCPFVILDVGAPKVRSIGRTASDPYTRKNGE
jgi:hypothetical protein